MRCTPKSTSLSATVRIDVTKRYRTSRYICADRSRSLRAVRGDGKTAGHQAHSNISMLSFISADYYPTNLTAFDNEPLRNNLPRQTRTPPPTLGPSSV